MGKLDGVGNVRLSVACVIGVLTGQGVAHLARREGASRVSLHCVRHRIGLLRQLDFKVFGGSRRLSLCVLYVVPTLDHASCLLFIKRWILGLDSGGWGRY